MAGRLFLTSATLLFVELLLIRWVPANVVYVGFFNNLVLMASFLGIGLGIVLGRRWSAWSVPLFGPLLLGLAVVVYAARVDLTGPGVFLGSSDRPQLRIDVAVVGVIGVFVMVTMAALAMPLAGLLRSMPPLRAYAIDIAGSMAGVAGFAVLAVLGSGPSVWLAILLALVILLGLSSARRRATYGGIAAVAAVLGITIALGRGDVWSPYYRIDLYDDADGLKSLAVNGVPHQKMWLPGSPMIEPYYEQVYEWLPGRRPERVLIIGAGTGTDVAIALTHGAGRVEAVEIDPLIQELGRELHPSRPYQDERVHVTIADGRAFLRSTDARYDLVVFGSTDSLTLVTSTANLRLESFLFTEEAFSSVRDHLTPSGVFVMYNWYREPWLVARYAGMLERTFGSPPAVRLYAGYTEVQAAALAAGPGLAGADIPAATVPEDTSGNVRDDAPFPYLRSRTIPASGLAALATLLVVALAATTLAMRLSSVALRQGSLHFFLLGAAFLLLETKSLVSFSLLFGTTWLVNALVFFAILGSVLAAIAVAATAPTRDPRWYYAGLFGSLAIAYAVPPSDLLFEPAALRYATASVMTFAPIFFANLVFARAFRDAQAADLAFASNLLGAMVGGAIEWSAISIGYRALALVVAGLYLGAYLTAARFRVLGDRSL